MILAFRMGPAASGLCDIDRVFFKVAKSRVKKLGLPKNASYWYIYGELPNF